MPIFNTSDPAIRKHVAKNAERLRAKFFTIDHPGDLSHKARCTLHEQISHGSRPTDYTLEKIAIEMNRPNEETLSRLLYILGERMKPIELSLSAIKLLHDDPSTEMFIDATITDSSVPQ